MWETETTTIQPVGGMTSLLETVSSSTDRPQVATSLSTTTFSFLAQILEHLNTCHEIAAYKHAYDHRVHRLVFGENNEIVLLGSCHCPFYVLLKSEMAAQNKKQLYPTLKAMQNNNWQLYTYICVYIYLDIDMQQTERCCQRHASFDHGYCGDSC